MRRSCPLGILVTLKKSRSGALRWRDTALQTKFGVRFAKAYQVLFVGCANVGLILIAV